MRSPQPAIDAIWVISDVAPDGTYVVTIQAGPDIAVTLDRDRALRYAMTAITAAARAEYDAAVFAQMLAMNLPDRVAIDPVIHLRQDRPALDHEATTPLRFEPIVMSRSRQPAVHVHLNGAPISEWTPDDTRGHALHVLDVVAGVDLDAAYHRTLVGPLGLDDARARAVVGDLINHRGAVTT